MGSRFDKAILQAMGATDHEMTVISVTDITPTFRRIRFHAPSMIDGRETPPASYLRLWAPDPSGDGKVHQRGYTLVDPDPSNGEVSLDFVLHLPSGPASHWAGKATIGDTIKASYFSSKKFERPEPEPAGYLIAGDAATFPAINAILNTLPKDCQIIVVLQDNDADDINIPIAAHEGVQYIRTGPGLNALADAIPDRDWSNWYAWIAGESLAVKTLRSRLNQHFGFPLTDITNAAYWIRGKQMRLKKERSVEDEPTDADAIASNSQVIPVENTLESLEVQKNRKPSQWRSQGADGLLESIKWKLRIAIAVQAMAAVMQMVPLVLLAEVARRLITPKHGLDNVATPLLWALVFYGLSGLVVSGLIFWLHHVDAAFGKDLRLKIVAKLSRLPLGWFSEKSSSAIRQAVDQDTARLHYRITHAVPDLVAAIVTPLAALLYLFTVSAALTGFLFIPILLYVILLISMIHGEGDNIARVADWSKRSSTAASTFINALPVVRIFGGGAQQLRDTLSGQAQFLKEWQRQMARRKLSAQFVVQPPVFLVVICAAGLWLIQRNSLQSIDLIPFLVLGTAFGPQISGILYSLVPLRESKAATRRIGMLLGEQELDQSRATRALPIGPTGLSFSNVSFGYRPNRPVIKELTLNCPPGSVTALVGPSGGGKSTLATLAGRFHDVSSGAINLTVGSESFDIRTLEAQSLQKTVGFVFQDVRLIAGTIRDNIALARPDAGLAEIISAAKAAQIHERIIKLPRGYDSVIGEDVRFSGGEAQRVSIARTLLTDPPVLILDEATAMADPDAEHLIQQALSSVADGRTVLMIAHRLQTIVQTDKIVVLQNGAIVEEGNHEALLARNGLYASMWRSGER